jgi:hypothetical protein
MSERLKVIKWHLTVVLSDGRVEEVIVNEDTSDMIDNYLLFLETKKLLNFYLKK